MISDEELFRQWQQGNPQALETVTRSDIESLPFGVLLKTFRTRQRLTQQHLATTLGMHRQAIIRWEQGDVLPATRGMVLELARCLRLNDQESRQLLEASLTALTPYWLVPLPRNRSRCVPGRSANSCWAPIIWMSPSR